MDTAREIRTILASRVTYHDGAYMAAPNLRHIGFLGLFEGSNAAMLFGVASRERSYRAESMDAAAVAIDKIFGKLGRPVYFESDPERSARLMRVFGNPVILTMGYADDAVVIGAYTARRLLSFLTLRRAFQSLERHLPEEFRLSFMSVDVPGQPRETLGQRRIRKKREKWERRAQRYEARARAAGKKAEESEE